MNRTPTGTRTMKGREMNITSMTHRGVQGGLWAGTACAGDHRYRWQYREDGRFHLEREDKARAAAHGSEAADRKLGREMLAVSSGSRGSPCRGDAYHHESDPGGGVIWRWRDRSKQTRRVHSGGFCISGHSPIPRAFPATANDPS
jgi:hypothetical protein